MHFVTMHFVSIYFVSLLIFTFKYLVYSISHVKYCKLKEDSIYVFRNWPLNQKSRFSKSRWISWTAADNFMVYYQKSCQCSVYKFDCKTEHNTTRYKNNWQHKTQWNPHWLQRNKRGGVQMWFSLEYSITCWNIHLKRQCNVLDASFYNVLICR